VESEAKPSEAEPRVALVVDEEGGPSAGPRMMAERVGGEKRKWSAGGVVCQEGIQVR